MTDDDTTPASESPLPPEAAAAAPAASEAHTEPPAEGAPEVAVEPTVEAHPEPAPPPPAEEMAPEAHVEPHAAAEMPPETHPEPAPADAPQPEAPQAAEAALEAPVPVKRTRKPKAAPAAESVATAVAPAPDDTSAAVATAGETPAEAAPAEPVPENKKKWYTVKIQSGREESIKAAIERKVKIEGLEQYFGQIVIPVEEVIVKKKVKVKNKKTGETTTQEKNVTKYNKKFPGYLFTEVEFNHEILYVFRETSGVGDFVGVTTKKTQGAVERTDPSPMTDAEVQSMLTGIPDPNKKRGGKGGKVVVKLDVEKGDKVRIKNGAFAGNEGEVKSITEAKDPTETPKVTVEVTIWGRPVPVTLDYWEVDKV